MPENMFDLSDTLKQIRVALSNYLLEQEKKRLMDLEILNISHRPFSILAFLKVRTSIDSQKMVMKTTVHHPVNIAVTKQENQSVVEYNILRYLYPRFEKIEKCSVPRPILILPEIETYLMGFVEGELLVDDFRYSRYLSSRNGFQLLKEYYYHCGRWLKHFKEFTGIRYGGAETLNGVVERCNYRLELIEALSDPRCPKNLREKVMGYLYGQLSQLKGEKISVSGCHGDFGSWNILVGPAGVSVIDFLGYGEDPFPVDLLKMLMSFEDGKKYLIYNPRRIEGLRKSFLEGFGPLPLVPTQVLTICETFHRICSVLACLSSKEARMHRRIERRLCLKANLEWLTNERQRKLLWPNSNH